MLITVESYKVGDWESKRIHTEIEDAIASAKMAVRYSWTSVDGNCYSVIDNIKHEIIVIKGDKKWKKFFTEHRDEIVTDF